MSALLGQYWLLIIKQLHYLKKNLFILHSTQSFMIIFLLVGKFNKIKELNISKYGQVVYTDVHCIVCIDCAGSSWLLAVFKPTGNTQVNEKYKLNLFSLIVFQIFYSMKRIWPNPVNLISIYHLQMIQNIQTSKNKSYCLNDVMNKSGSEL